MKINQSLKITVAFLKTLAPGTPALFADTDIPGFQVAVGSKTITFYLHRKLKQRIHRIALGHYPALPLPDARRIALQKIGSLENYGSIDSVSAQPSPSIGEAMDFYLSLVKNKPCTLSGFKYFQHLRSRRIADVSHQDVLNVHQRLIDTPGAANNAVKCLSAAISKITKKLRIQIINPASGVSLYPYKPRKRFLSETEAPLLLEKIEELRKLSQYTVQADALLMLIYTGARKSNVLRMNLRNLDGNHWIIPEDGDVVGERSKNGEELDVPLNDFALDIIQKRTKEAIDGYLFCYRGKPLKDVRKTFLAACAAAGVEDCHIHDLRRTLGSWMLSQGTPIAVVSRMLGHKSIHVTERVYAHMMPNKISESTTAAILGMRRGKA